MGYSWLDFLKSGGIAFNNLSTALVQLDVGDPLVLGVARLLRVGLTMLDKDVFLKHVAARDLNWRRNSIAILRRWGLRGGSWSWWRCLSDGVRSSL